MGGGGYRRVVADDGVVTGRDRRRAGLVAAVFEVVRVEGRTVSMDDLARAAKVPKSVLYNHFADRAGVFRAVGDAAADDVCRRLQAASTHGAGAQGGRAGVEAFVVFAETEPHLYEVLRAGTDRHASADRAERIGRQLAAAVAPNRPGDATVAALAAAGVMFAVVDGWRVRRTIDRDELIDRLLAFLQAGLTTA